MLITRWKVMTILFGLAAGGLAATADQPCPALPFKAKSCPETVQVARIQPAIVPLTMPAPSTDTIQVAFQAPTVVEPPKPTEAPKVAPVALQPTLELPAIPAVSAAPKLAPVAVDPPQIPSIGIPTIEAPKVDAPKIRVTAVEPPKIDSPKVDAPKIATIELPTIEQPRVSKPQERVVEIPLPTRIEPKHEPKVELPRKAEPGIPEVTIPGLNFDAPKPVIAAAPAEIKELAKPIPANPVPRVTPVSRVENRPPAVTVSSERTRPESNTDLSQANSSVRVLLRIGNHQPNFDVLQGDDTLLKVVSDRVEVRSPGGSADVMMTPLKAAGSIRFSAPGCEGTCDELTVMPLTGEVIALGHVSVRCKKGKGETQIQGNEMRFHLGTAPAYSVAEPRTR